MDRVTGELAKRVGQVTSFPEVEPSILDKILAYPEWLPFRLVASRPNKTHFTHSSAKNSVWKASYFTLGLTYSWIGNYIYRGRLWPLIDDCFVILDTLFSSESKSLNYDRVRLHMTLWHLSYHFMSQSSHQMLLNYIQLTKRIFFNYSLFLYNHGRCSKPSLIFRAEMADVKRLLILSIILLLFLSQSFLLCSGHDDDQAGQTRKLGVFIRKRGGGGYRRARTTTSASATLLSGSFHMTACLVSSFLLSLIF